MRPISQSTLVILALLCVAGPLSATDSLTTFEELKEALFGGEYVRVVAHYHHCELIGDGESLGAGPEAVGGMAVETFEYFAAGVVGNESAYIAFSHAQLIAHRGYVLNYVRFRVYEDGLVEITARYLDPAGHEVLMDQLYHGVINEGVRFFRQGTAR